MNERDYKKIIEKQEKTINDYKLEVDLLKKQLLYYKKAAYTDSLTNLGNRRSLENIGKYDCVILGDIDQFKKINDEYGHNIGDQVLVEISEIFRKLVRESDFVCRWGGEEFVILLKNCNDNNAYKKTLKLKEEISKLSKKFGFKISMSFGISHSIENEPLAVAIEKADKAMYKSKENGRNTITIYKLTKSIDF